MDNQIDLKLTSTNSVSEEEAAARVEPAVGASTVKPLVDFDVPEANSDLGPIVYVDPAVCHPFDGSPRGGYQYDERRDADLTADIEAHGIIEPVIVIKRRGGFDILSGNRRHAVITHLRDRGIEVRMPTRVAIFDRLDAVAFATACNVGRSAPTAMELARSVQWTLNHVEKSQVAVAKALGMDQAKVSHLCVLASLPEWIIDIVTDPEALSENFAALIGPGLADEGEQQIMKERAERLRTDNVTLAGPAAARYLRNGESAVSAVELRDSSGDAFGSVKRDPRGGVSLRVSPRWRKAGDNPMDLIKLATKALTAAMQDEA